MGWLSSRLPALAGAWLSNDVLACRDFAVAWLKRGASASKVLELGMPATVLPASRGRGHFHGGSGDRGRSA